MNDTNLLVIDDNHLICQTLEMLLRGEGYQVLVAESGRAGLAKVTPDTDLILLDHKLPDTDGLTMLRRIKAIDPNITVVIMTAYASIDNAVEAMKLGAYDYLNKPFDIELAEGVIKRALETTQLRRDLRSLREEQAEPYAFDKIIGNAQALVEAKRLLERVARSPATTVLLNGESGTGKDLAANAIHFNSGRVSHRFMNITCSALPETLLESELFGHERGAFTDAKRRKKGLLELADGGTVFLDEIGEMTPPVQAKLLRFLEERSFKRVGGEDDVHVDVRIIAATNRDLRKEVQEGRFREDLFYRLNVLPICMPSLRERKDDIPTLVRYYIERFNAQFGKNVQNVSVAALRLLCAYGWPGNIRELRNLVERAMLLVDDRLFLEPDDFLMSDNGKTSATFSLPPEGVDIEKVERSLVVQALQRAGGNQTAAAKLLNLHRDQIRYRIKKFDLVHEQLSGCL